MRSHLKVPALAIVAILIAGACTGAATPAPSAAPSAAPPTTAPASASAPPSTAASPSVAAVPTPEPAKDCARTTDAGAMQMWERSRRQQGHGRHARRDVEREEPRPQDQPDLHPARRDGGKIAQGDRVRRGSRPDGHGPDLRPAVREGRAARRHHRPDQGLARAEDGQPGPHDGRDVSRTGSTACRSTPTSRRCSTTRTCSRRPASTRTSRRPASPSSATYADKITALGGDVKGYYLPGNCAGCNIFTVGPLMWASGATIEAGRRRRRAARRRRRQAGAPVRARHGQGRQRPRGRPGRERRDLPPAVRLRQGRHDGHRQLQHHAGPRAEPDDEVRHRAAAGREAGLGRLVHRRRPGRRPEGQQARRRRGRLHEVPALRRGPGRGATPRCST